MNLNQDYWEERYRTELTGWDTGGPTPPFTDYIDQLESKELKILIPGAGNAYEAEYLFNQGFLNVDVVDLAKEPLENLKIRVPDFPEEQLIQRNFFDHAGDYDLVLEQTFFCAIDPAFRPRYAEKVYELLVPGGKLVGVLWSGPMNDTNPPFGGSKEEYKSLFESRLKIKVLEPCYNSIKPRMGRELFINMEKEVSSINS
ncbi:MAG: SAM-dependent methyltransferase [Bacteroidota bacterium]